MIFTHFIESDLTISLNVKGKVRTTLMPLNYYSEILGKYIQVPTFTDTDFGSIPRIFQGLIPKDGKGVYAYILHDYLYQSGLYTRAQSDKLLKEALEALEVNWLHRNSVYSGVRVGGFVAWNKYRKKEI